MMKFVESKEMTCTKIKNEAKTTVTENIIAALGDIYGAENVGMARTGSGDSKKNEVAVRIGTVEVGGEEVPICVTVNVSAKPYTDSPATAKRVYAAFDFDENTAAYEDYLTDKATKAAEKAELKAKKIAKDEAARKAKAEATDTEL